MPRSSDPDEAESSNQTQNQGMESESSTSGQSDEGGSGTSETGTSSSQLSQSSEGQNTPPVQRRVQPRTHQQHQQRRHTRTSVGCQTEYTEVWTKMRDPNCTDDDEEPSSSEGTLRLLIQNFRSMSDTVRGPSKEIMGVSWRIMVMPRQHVVQKKGTQKCLGFFLQCCPDAYSELWQCTAQAELRLISQKANIPHFTRKTNHTYTSKENDWGYSCFMTWADILDESQGYIKEDRVILEVTVKAEQAKNILSHCEFKKRVSKWRNLAEMHFSRNCIDLAIEANFQAIKFCRDRDNDVKTELEEQRAYFIEQKVQESIERIQKKTEEPQSEEQGTSQSALKQALTQNTAKKRKPQKKNARRNRDQSRSNTPPPSGTTAQGEVRVEDHPVTETASVCKMEGGSEDDPQPSRSRRRIRLRGMFNPKLGEIIMSSKMFHKMKEFDSMPNVDADQIRKAIAWTRRNKEEDNFYTNFTLPESYEKFKLQIEEQESLETYDADLIAYDHETQTMFLEQLFHSSILEIFNPKLEKQERSEEADKLAKEFEEEVKAKVDGSPDETTAVEEEIAFLGATLNFIEDEESMKWRHDILDRADVQLVDETTVMMSFYEQHPELFDPNIKIRLNETIPEEARWLREAFYSEDEDYEDEEYSSDDDQDYRKNTGATLVEMACQTDIVPRSMTAHEATFDAALQNKGREKTVVVNAQPQRSGKKAAKRTSKAPATLQTNPESTTTSEATAETPSATPPQANGQYREWSQPEEVEEVPPIDEEFSEETAEEADLVNGSFKAAQEPNSGAYIARILPMEYAMTFFPPNIDEEPGNSEQQLHEKMTEDFVRGWIADAERQGQLDGTGPTNCIEFINAHRDQVVSALNGTGHIFTRVRHLIHVVHEMVTLIEKKDRVRSMHSIFDQIFKMAGINFESPAELPSLNPPDISVGDENVALTNEINFIIAVIERLKQIDLSDDQLIKKLNEAVKALGSKMLKASSSVEEIRKSYKEKEVNLKKEEKVLKAELASLRGQLQTEKDRANALQKEVKDKTKEIKRLENRANTVTAERDDLSEKLRNAQNESKNLTKKHSDETNKLRRDLTQANESRKALQNGIIDHENQNKSQQHTIDEKNSQLKKVRHELAEEKKKVNGANNELEKALERAKKSEIDLLTRELEAGITLLERASSDAGKHCNEMEDAVNKARTQAEMNVYATSKKEWTQVVEVIKGYIKKAEVEFHSHIEAIQAGKALSSLPKVSVAKPPPAPQIVKVPVIAQVEPTKNAPGPIGPPRNQAHAPSQVSPQRAASPVLGIQKMLPQQASPSSPPIRHQPGAIGTRPNGITNGHGLASNGVSHNAMNGSGLNGFDRSLFDNSNMLSGHQGNNTNHRETNNSNSILSNWSWSEPLENMLNSHTSPCSDLLSVAAGQQLRQSTIDHNGWDEQNNTWSNHPAPNQSMHNQQQNHNSLNNYISGPLHTSASQNHNYAAAQNRASSAANNIFGAPPGWNRPNSAQERQERQLIADHQKQIYFRNWQETVACVEKKLHIDSEKAFEFTRRYMQGNPSSLLSARADPEAIADTIIQKYMMEHAARNNIPPGAAPGYLQNPMLNSGYGDRSGFNERNSMANNMPSMLNGGHESYGLLGLLGDSMRPSSTADKWSNGL